MFSCLDYSTRNTQKIRIAYFSGDRIVSIKKLVLSGRIDYRGEGKGSSMSFVLLEDDFIAAFYHVGNDNVLEILEYPYCLNFSLCTYNNSDSENLNFRNYLSINENNEQPLKIYFIELTDSSIGLLKFSSNHSIIKENNPYDIEELYFHSNAISGTFTSKFAGVNYNNYIGRTCELTITINP